MVTKAINSAAKIKKELNVKTIVSNGYIKKITPKTIVSNAKIKKLANKKTISCGMYFRQVPPTRATTGKSHRITGTIIQVLGELDTAGIRPLDIYYYSDDGTNAVCVYRRGN